MAVDNWRSLRTRNKHFLEPFNSRKSPKMFSWNFQKDSLYHGWFPPKCLSLLHTRRRIHHTRLHSGHDQIANCWHHWLVVWTLIEQNRRVSPFAWTFGVSSLWNDKTSGLTSFQLNIGIGIVSLDKSLLQVVKNLKLSCALYTRIGITRLTLNHFMYLSMWWLLRFSTTLCLKNYRVEEV